ncbi:MAG: dTMP kinase [Candidatus Dormibacteria bacterium]
MVGSRWPGYFISFEGLDGAGKSTQVAALSAALRAAGRDAVSIRPSDTELGDMARSFLLQHQAGFPLEPWAEALLFIASRAQLLREIVLPALRAGQVVVVDRWADSTLAYQGGGRGLDLEALRALHRQVVDDVWPDLTIYLDLPLATAMHRQRAEQLPLDRIEQQPGEFHARVEATFRGIVQSEPQRIVSVDATGSAVGVSRSVWEVVRTRLQHASRTSPEAVGSRR